MKCFDFSDFSDLHESIVSVVIVCINKGLPHSFLFLLEACLIILEGVLYQGLLSKVKGKKISLFILFFLL